MDFELKTLRLAQAARAKADALVFLVTQDTAKAKADDALSALAARAIKAGDFSAEAGKLLPCYAAEGIQAPRVLLAGAGDGSAQAVRRAVAAAIALIKSGPARQAVLCFAQTPSPAALRAAVLAAADAAYAYTETKPKAKPVALTAVRLALPAAASAALKTAFAQAQATASGIRLAREWGNRPANHATPRQLAAAAQAIAKEKGSHINCEVLGPKEVAKLGMGAFAAVAVPKDYLHAVAEACTVYAVAGELAAQGLQPAQSGSFAWKLIDSLAAVSAQEVAARAKVEWI